MRDIVRFLAFIAILFYGTVSAEAKLTKYYYFKWGSSVWAHKTMAECEAHKVKFNSGMDKIIKSIKPGSGHVVVPPAGYCLNFLPLGYERPQG